MLLALMVRAVAVNSDPRKIHPWNGSVCKRLASQRSRQQFQALQKLDRN